MKYLLIILSFCCSLNIFSQSVVCGTDEYNDILRQQNPEKYRLAEEDLQMKLDYDLYPEKDTIEIPIVFHVVWRDSVENLHDSIILQQLDVLNKAFNLENADTTLLTDTLVDWKGNFRIRFVLPTSDPWGDWSNGITRTKTEELNFSYWNNRIKSDLTGGKSPWRTDKYMNVWIGNLASGLLGYSQFPGGPDSTDGNVIDFAVVGNQMYPWTYNSQYAMGKVLVHEVGHWLNLYHPWGNNGGCSEDYIPETGTQAYPITTSYNCPDTLMSTCPTPTQERIFVKHYMDYCGDSCIVTFTKGQVHRGLTSLYSYRTEMVGNQSVSNTEEIKPDFDIKIKPTITRGRIYIELPEYEGRLDIELYDMRGRTVYSSTLFGERRYELFLGKHTNGTYIFQIIVTYSFIRRQSRRWQCFIFT